MINARSGDDTYRSMVESILDCAIFKLDMDGRILNWNAGAERINGCRRQEVLGRHFSILHLARTPAAESQSASLWRQRPVRRASLAVA